jgi:hypothetical protein
LLLELVCITKKDSRVSVRDATFLYEIDIREGTPRRATRTASDGNYQSGERALGSLLAVGAGRFVVSPAAEPVRGDLSGTLFDLLARPIAQARGALAATTGANTVNVEHIGLDEASLEEYLRATPEPARGLIRRLAGGASPRQMLLGGEASPSMLEDVLADLSARDAVRAVVGANGADLLTPAVANAVAQLQGVGKPGRSMPPNARASSPAPGSVPAPASVAPKPAPPRPARRPPTPVGTRPSYETLTLSDAPEAMPERPSNAPPSSLEDAVMRELSDRSPAPGAARATGSDPPPIIEPSELKRRSSNPPADDDSDESMLPSIPPDAIVPGAASSDEMAIAPVAVFEGTSATARQAAGADPVGIPRPARPHGDAEVEEAAAPVAEPDAGGARDAAVARKGEAAEDGKKRSRWGYFVAVTLVAAAAFLALRATGGSEEEGRATTTGAATPIETPSPTAAATASTGASATAAPVEMPPTNPATATREPTAVGDDVPPGAEVPAGYGLIVIEAPARARVRVDGTLVGVGPATAVAAPGYHEVRVEQGGRDTKSVVEVRAGKMTHAGSTPVP